MTQLNDYFRCDAYENNNSVYVLDNNGFKLFNANDTELLKGHNVYTVLSWMSYLHGSSFGQGNSRLIERVKDAKPDFIVITGDMYSSGDEKGKQTAINLMTDLAKFCPVYFVNRPFSMRRQPRRSGTSALCGRI